MSPTPPPTINLADKYVEKDGKATRALFRLIGSLQARIDDLEAANNTLKGDLDLLEGRVDVLEAET